MKLITFFTLFILLFRSFLFAQEERKVLVEVFTNSHCPLCPAAHNVIDNYLSGPNGDKISYIYYHMIYPYNDDQLYWESKEGSDARDNYYSPVHATPQGWFDGTLQGGTSGWAASLDNLVSTQSPLKIILSGTRNPTQFNINAQLTRTGDIPDNDLVIHFIIAEDLYYAGRNGISNHRHVMRKMFPTPDGLSFTIDLNETKDIPQTIDIDPLWDADSLNVAVFVQSTGSMTVYQSETISYNELNVTGLKNSKIIPDEFVLEQNYPNPFNPSTIIKYQIPKQEFVSLKVFDALGNEVATLVNDEQQAGSHNVNFNSAGLASGIYFYKIQAGNFIATKKMVLMK
ncbi:MAG: T9SS type A sorting domain-containing protein [Ignavibacteriaceae bacterium]|nr:T9SS type A sorting domain-containing protein [Ignavibacteriaceae bacterium]